MDQVLTLNVNGQTRTVTTDPLRPLLHVLREDLDLTGTKYGCGEGQCAACTVLVDGKPAFSCLTPVSGVVGAKVVTIQGLSDGQTLHPVQSAFLEAGAFQCGYCTPGMILATVALLAEKPRATPEEARAWMNGHLCRCCGYERTISAVLRALDAARPKG
jgi:aerobic-type carbon monoxide dehydrogenase small subunit (CoxS/CutS family)